MNPTCHICSTASEFLMNKDGFDEYLCPVCGLSFVFPQPGAEWLKKEVYSYESGYQGNKRNDLAARPEDSKSRQTLDFLVEKKNAGTLLDVGCSNGQFMFWAKQKGFSCTGVEINARTASIAEANGFAVHRGFLDTAPFDKESFDVVYLGDVIEHVNDPRKFIKTAGKFLKPGGFIVISTPNMDCLWAGATLRFYKIFGIPWAAATPPHHLFQFSYSNLNSLMAEQDLKPVYSVFTRPPRLKYELGSLHLLKRFKKRKTFGNFIFMVFSFAIYSVAHFINNIISPLLRKNFQMVVFYEKPVSR